jgi:hypothetical protein
VTVCGDYEAALTGPLGGALAGNPGAVGLNGTLARYGGKLAHWSYLVTSADDNTQLANDLGNAGLALTEAGVAPSQFHAADLRRAVAYVGSVTSDCNQVQ